MAHSWDSDSNSDTSLMDTWMHAILNAMSKLSTWRSRIFFLMYASSFIPSNSVSLKSVQVTFATLNPKERKKFDDMNLKTPEDIVKVVKYSKILEILFISALMVAVVMLCLTSVKAVTQDSHDARVAIFSIETICIAIFTVEVILQLICVRNSMNESFAAVKQKLWGRMKRKDQERHKLMMANMSDAIYLPDHSKGAWKWIILDTLATMPFYVEIGVAVAQSSEANEGFDGTVLRLYQWDNVTGGLRALRLIRITRLLKVIQKSKKLRVMMKAMVNSMEGIWLLLYSVPLFVVFFSVLLFYAEQTGSEYKNGAFYYTSDGSMSPFQSIPDCGVMICSLFVIAFPLSMITMQYTHVVRIHAERQKNLEAKAAIIQTKAEEVFLKNDHGSPPTSPNAPGEVGGKDGRPGVDGLTTGEGGLAAIAEGDVLVVENLTDSKEKEAGGDWKDGKEGDVVSMKTVTAKNNNWKSQFKMGVATKAITGSWKRMTESSVDSLKAGSGKRVGTDGLLSAPADTSGEDQTFSEHGKSVAGDSYVSTETATRLKDSTKLSEPSDSPLSEADVEKIRATSSSAESDHSQDAAPKDGSLSSLKSSFPRTESPGPIHFSSVEPNTRKLLFSHRSRSSPSVQISPTSPLNPKSRHTSPQPPKRNASAESLANSTHTSLHDLQNSSDIPDALLGSADTTIAENPYGLPLTKSHTIADPIHFADELQFSDSPFGLPPSGLQLDLSGHRSRDERHHGGLHSRNYYQNEERSEERIDKSSNPSSSRKRHSNSRSPRFGSTDLSSSASNPTVSSSNSRSAAGTSAKSKSSRGDTSIRDVERLVDVRLGEAPGEVHLKVMDWNLVYQEDKREEVLKMRIKVKDQEQFRRLMRLLAEFH
ncbi:hypothetical protein HDV05_000117 [Chytridiales sp. JEL 0842]|nr:hypothetical protein HDV05_000117 [Chytridiales sp. JEL 0842]